MTFFIPKGKYKELVLCVKFCDFSVKFSSSLALSFFLAAFIPLCYSFALNLWYIVPASILAGFVMGVGEIARVNFITIRAKDEDIPTYQEVDFTLMGIRGIIAPFVGISLMSWIGIRSAFYHQLFYDDFFSLTMALFSRCQFLTTSR